MIQFELFHIDIEGKCGGIFRGGGGGQRVCLPPSKMFFFGGASPPPPALPTPMNLKQKIGNNSCYCCFQLGYLNDHQFGGELFIRSTVKVHQFVCVLLSLSAFKVGYGIWLY